jgi:alkylation response protein AidB-like acyl-CoA dehydrogenase
MDFNLSSEQKLIKQTAADFAADELLKGAVERDINKIWPTEQISKMAELGFMGMMVNEEWGGSGLDSISYCIAMEEISKVDASAGVIMSVNNSLVCYLLQKYGSNYIKDTYLKKLAKGEKLGAFSNMYL